MLSLITNKDLSILQSSLLLPYNEKIVHGFGLRSIILKQYFEVLNIKDRYVVETDQIHGDTVHLLLYPKKDKKLEGDAFVSGRSGLVCYVRTADCVPILLYDKKNNVVAAIHAGWRGTAKNIVKRTIESMNAVFGTNTIDIIAVIGPRICPKCFEVGDEVVLEMEKLISEDEWFLDSRHIDLGKINYDLLLRNGVCKENIDISDLCTFCDSRFASWRRDKNPEERQFNFIMIK